MSRELTEQEQVRRENLQKIIDLGINPFPSKTFPVSHSSKEVHDGFTEGSTDFQEVCIAGRLMSRRIMGKASFAEIQDSAGRIQIYVSRDDICPGENKDLYNQLFKKLLDFGDYIGIKGFAFFTKTGTLSIHLKEFTFLAKSLKPLPIVKTDAEALYYNRCMEVQLQDHLRHIIILWMCHFICVLLMSYI